MRRFDGPLGSAGAAVQLPPQLRGTRSGVGWASPTKLHEARVGVAHPTPPTKLHAEHCGGRSPPYPGFPPLRTGCIIGAYAHHRDPRTGKVLPRVSEEGGTPGRARRAVPPHVSHRRGRARHRPGGRTGRVRRVPWPERRGQDDHAEAPLRRHQSHGRLGTRDGARAVAARERLPPPLRAGDGAEEPTLVGSAGRRVLPPAPADLPHRARAVPPHARRVDQPAGSGQPPVAAGPRVVLGRADEDGTDRRAVALAGSALSRRADHRPRRGRAAQHPRLSCATTSSAAK